MTGVTNKPWMGKAVVIIDDSARVREELRNAFVACGMTVAGEAETGSIGLDLVKQHKPEMVSLDLIMPEMDGVECYRKITAVLPDTKIVLISWLGGEEKILDNLKDIIPGHLFQTKPCSREDLEARLERIYFPQNTKLGGKPLTDTVDDFLDLGIVKVS